MPPPVIILVAKLEICHNHANFSAGHDKDKEDDKQETKDVVVLVAPERIENKVELDKHSTEGQKAAKKRLNSCVLVPVALW